MISHLHCCVPCPSFMVRHQGERAFIQVLVKTFNPKQVHKLIPPLVHTSVLQESVSERHM